MNRHSNVIGGESVRANSGREFVRYNPADATEVVGAFAESGPLEVEMAVEAAERALRTWQSIPPPNRAEVLLSASEKMMQQSSAIARLITREEGKTLTESAVEIGRATEALRFYAGAGRRFAGQQYPSESRRQVVFTLREPLGVVAVITPWNFPLAIPCYKIAPALICGNSVVFKPASFASGTAIRLAEILHESGLPPGTLNVITGPGGALGPALACDPRVSAISFTGSYPTGKSLYEAAAPSLTRTQLETGAKNCAVVLSDADLELAADHVVRGAFGGAGQSCMATSLVLTQESVYGDLLGRVVGRARALKVGNGLDPSVDMGPKVSEEELEKTLMYVELGRKEGARLVSGGERLDGRDYDRGWFMHPAVFADVDPGMRIAREEIFGPVVGFVPVSSLTEALDIVNSSEYGLCASVHTKSLAAAYEFALSARAGIIKVNRPTTGMEVQVPFGGVRHSSADNFRELGDVALEFYSRTRTVYMEF